MNEIEQRITIECARHVLNKSVYENKHIAGLNQRVTYVILELAAIEKLIKKNEKTQPYSI